ncbi:MAG TPA: UvrD-helicase domain-containing protein [Elusimicrobiota bacterium]|nr:UvrD-helicase domain-containing protein [Elusimicrobiota bacterium]
MSSSLFQNLNAPQQEAVLQTEGPVLVLAGAGSGKTRVITTRIAYMVEQGVAPWHILAVTFTNKASEEMQTRLDQMTGGRGRGVVLSTFHRFCAQFLRREGQAIGLAPHFIIYDDHDQKELVKDCLTELNLDDKKFKPGVLVSVISRAKDELIDAASYEIHTVASPDPFRQMVSSIYHLYQKKLTQSNALDFGDLIMKSVELLRDRAEVREKYQDRFRYILVDEYQDTNRAQYVLTKTLAAKHRNLCVVGDDDQCVYVWRGADIRNILEFEKEYPEAKVVKLEQNYRSTRLILDAAWNVVQHNQFRKEKKLWTDKNAGEPVTADEFADEREEALAVASAIHQKVRTEDFRYADFAVFYRINAQSRVLEDALRRLEIPYKIIGAVRFYDRAEVKNVIAYLRVVANPADELSLKRIFNIPARGLGKTSLEAIARHAQERRLSLLDALARAADIADLTGRARSAALDFHTLLSTFMAKRDAATALQMTGQILEATGYLRGLESDDDAESQSRAQNIREFLNAIAEYEERSEDKSLTGFLEQVSLVADADEIESGPNYVTLMTVHLAKGLEFPAVFLTGMEEGLFPIGESDFSQEDLEEERRLCYVGMTRAKRRLHLTWSASRRLFGHSRWNAPSRFIEEAGIAAEPAHRRPGGPTRSPTEASPTPRYAETPARASGDMPVDETSLLAYSVGMRVRHPEFGMGKIIEKSGAGDHLKVMVLFDSGQWKKLLVKYAGLEKV